MRPPLDKVRIWVIGWSGTSSSRASSRMLLALASFVVTFVVTRVIVRMIRAGKGPFGNVKAGDLHIHHVVPGVVLTVIGGFGAVASGRYGFGASAFAVIFGVGAGLVLDEFALILHLDDVYWTEDGRKSVEVVVLTAALVGLVLGGLLAVRRQRRQRPGTPGPYGRDRHHRAELLLRPARPQQGQDAHGDLRDRRALRRPDRHGPAGQTRLAVGPALLPAQAARPGQVPAARLPARPPLGRTQPQASGVDRRQTRPRAGPPP